MAISNPSMNFRVWELYKQLITGEKAEQPTSLTTAVAKQAIIGLSDLRMELVTHATFVLKNTGDNPLIIQDIKSSCGCTAPSWSKEPVNPGDKTEIQVEIKPEEPGYFHKTIDVYCNVKEKNIQLTVQGTVVEKTN